MGWVTLQTPEGRNYYHNPETNELTWEKPACMRTEQERADEGAEFVWVPHPDHAFLPAKVTQELAGGHVTVQTLGDEPTVSTVKRADLIPMHKSSLGYEGIDDLVQLSDVNPPSILHLLRQRFELNEIYTWVGTILVSINPFQRLPIYTPQIIQQYARAVSSTEVPPHVYTIAAAAFKGIKESRQSHSILISGESGAGKTEATKQCLSYLSEVAGSTTGVEQKVLAANPILEAFGNAKTLRNNNSSRFGKFMELHFNNRNQIAGCKTEPYLLEKSRVVFQTGGERNYHIFYQLCAGLEAAEAAALQLGAADEYAYLAASDINIPGVDDSDEFHTVQQAADDCSITPQEQMQMFKVCAGILHLGNIQFVADSGGEGSEIAPGSDRWLASASQLLGVDQSGLAVALRQLHHTIRGENITVLLKPEQAVGARDALAKALYSRMFYWLVTRINAAMAVDTDTPGGRTSTKAMAAAGGAGTVFIGILDIFGFEIFEQNSFEQLCINFANEKLQQHFNLNTFKLEEELYTSEQIQFDHVEYIDNQPVLDLIEGGKTGLLVILDDEINVPRSTDDTFLNKVDRQHASSKRYVPSNRCKELGHFQVLHYAGTVDYNAQGFLEKNKDTLFDDLVSVVGGSSDPFVAETLFAADVAAQVNKGRGKKITQGGQFKSQLAQLMATLATTHPEYIRCIKPNSSKVPSLFEASSVLQQLRYSGVFEAVAIRKEGFPFRYTHEAFFKRFRVLINESRPGAKQSNYSEACGAMIEVLRSQYPSLELSVAVGRSMVLYRAPTHRGLTLYRDYALDLSAVLLQRVLLGWLCRCVARKMRAVRTELRAAMQSRQLPALQAAVAKGDDLFFPLADTQRARDMVRAVQEEQAMLERLRRPVPSDLDGAMREYADMIDVIATWRACDAACFALPEITRACTGERMEGVLKAVCLKDPEQHYGDYDKVVTFMNEWRDRYASDPSGPPFAAAFTFGTAADTRERCRKVRDRRECSAALTAACDTFDLPALEAALATAQGITKEQGDVLATEVRRGTEVRAHLVTENQLADAVEAALRATPISGSAGQIDVSGCSGQGCETAAAALANHGPRTERGKKLQALGRQMGQLRNDFKRCVESGLELAEPIWKNVTDLASSWAVTAVAEGGLPADHPLAAELELLRNDLMMRAAVEDVVAQVTEAGAAMDEEALRFALEGADKLKLTEHHDADVRAVVVAGKQLFDQIVHTRTLLERGLATLTQAVLEEGLSAAGQCGYGESGKGPKGGEPLRTQAQEMRDYIDTTVTFAKHALLQRDIALLKQALDSCFTDGFQFGAEGMGGQGLATELRGVHEGCVAAHDALTNAQSTMGAEAESLLRFAVQLSEGCDYGGSGKAGERLTSECRELLQRVVEVTAAARAAVVVVVEEEMKGVVAAADGLRLVEDNVEEIRRILSLPVEKRLQVQIRAASALHDEPRKFALTVRMKDLIFQRMTVNGQFKLASFPHLRDPADYGSIFGLMQSEAREQGMLYWSKEPIPKTLLRTNFEFDPPSVRAGEQPAKPSKDQARELKALRKTALNLFKNVMGYMGDRQLQYPEMLGHELLATCLDEPKLRDEVYCQIIKQLSNNPGRESKTKGWNLMALCLSTFPPSPQLENYLEVFLRLNQQQEALRKLHRIVFDGQRPIAPTSTQVLGVRDDGARFTLWGRGEEAKEENARRPTSTQIRGHQRGAIFTQGMAVDGANAPPPAVGSAAAAAAASAAPRPMSVSRYATPAPAPVAPPPPAVVTALVMYDYDPHGEAEMLKVTAGETVIIADCADPDWWLARRSANPAEEGWVPSNYVEKQ